MGCERLLFKKSNAIWDFSGVLCRSGVYKFNKCDAIGFIIYTYHVTDHCEK
jgi:hypothetical protein